MAAVTVCCHDEMGRGPNWPRPILIHYWKKVLTLFIQDFAFGF